MRGEKKNKRNAYLYYSVQNMQEISGKNIISRAFGYIRGGFFASMASKLKTCKLV